MAANIKIKSLKIIIIGSNGQLGNEFCEQLSDRFNIIQLSRDLFDLTELDKFEYIIDNFQPDIVINCAAIVNLDFCETNKELALKVNATAPIALSKICDKHKIKFIHFSSDYVFDGIKKDFYLEEDDVNPLSYYGETKAISEKGVLHSNNNSIVFRISWVYSKNFKNNFLYKIINKYKANEQLSVVSDQFGTPTSTNFIVSNIKKIFENGKYFEMSGIFHLTPLSYISWHGFADRIFYLHTGKKVKINKITQKDFKSSSNRPIFSALNSNKFFNLTGNQNITWEEDLEIFFHN